MRFELVSANLFYRLLYKLTDETIPMNTGDFRLIGRKVVNALKNMQEQLRLVYERIFTEDLVPGWTSLMVVLLFSSGAILVVLGIMGEYIARIYEEIKGRPIYVIDHIVEAKRLEDAADEARHSKIFL